MTRGLVGSTCAGVLLGVVALGAQKPAATTFSGFSWST